MSQAGGPSEAMQQALREAGNSARQSSGNPMDLNSIPGNIAKGFGQTPGFDKPIGQGIGGKTIQDTVNEGSLVKSIVPGGELDGLKNIQTVDNSAKISGQVGTIAPPVLQHAALGTNKGQQGQGQ